MRERWRFNNIVLRSRRVEEEGEGEVMRRDEGFYFLGASTSSVTIPVPTATSALVIEWGRGNEGTYQSFLPHGG